MDLTTSVVLLGIAIIIFYLFGKWRQQYWTRKGIPQLDPNVIFGDFMPLYTARKSIPDFFLELYKHCKSAGLKHVGLYNTWSPEYVPIDLEEIKLILTKDFNHFGSHGVYHHKKDPFSMHLFNLDGEAWKERRIKFTPLFTTGKMKMMFGIVAEKATVLNQVVGKHISNGEPVNIRDTCARFTTDVIGSVAFGLECDTLNVSDHKFRTIGKKALKPDIWKLIIESILPFSFLGAIGYRGTPREVEAYFTGVVKDVIRYREENKVQRNDFMQLMIQLKNTGSLTADEGFAESKNAKHYVTEQEIINEAYLFYLAGFETSSSAMTFALFELARNPDIQEKLRREILKTLEKHDGNITYEVIMEMEYLDKVVKETLRKYPVLSGLPRECTKDYKLPNSDAVIRKGTSLNIPVIGIHMDPDYYPNPEEFNPENFSPENKAKRPDMAWMPFGEGPRMCIGLRFGVMQSKLGIVALLKDFRFTLDKTMKPPYEADTGSFIYVFKKDVMLRATRV